MRKVLAVLLIMALAVCFTAPAFADVGERLQSGLERLVKSPTNIPTSISEEYEAAEFKPFGAIAGLIKGVTLTIVDIGLGAAQTLTCPLDIDFGNN